MSEKGETYSTRKSGSAFEEGSLAESIHWTNEAIIGLICSSAYRRDEVASDDSQRSTALSSGAYLREARSLSAAHHSARRRDCSASLVEAGAGTSFHLADRTA